MRHSCPPPPSPTPAAGPGPSIDQPAEQQVKEQRGADDRHEYDGGDEGGAPGGRPRVRPYGHGPLQPGAPPSCSVGQLDRQQALWIRLIWQPSSTLLDCAACARRGSYPTLRQMRRQLEPPVRPTVSPNTKTGALSAEAEGIGSGWGLTEVVEFPGGRMCGNTTASGPGEAASRFEWIAGRVSLTWNPDCSSC